MNYFLKVPMLSLALLTLVGSTTMPTGMSPSAINSFNEGMALLLQKKYAAAQYMFETTCKHPQNSLEKENAHYYVAVCAMHRRQVNAIPLFDEFIKLYPASCNIEVAHYHMGNICFEKHDFKKSITHYLQIDEKKLSRQAEDERNYALGCSYLKVGNYKQAIPCFEAILQESKHPYYHAAHYQLGYIYMQQGAFATALTQLAKAYEHKQYQVLATTTILQLYYVQKNYQALVNHSSALPATSISPEGLLLVGDAYFFLQNYERAVTHYQDYESHDKILDRETLYKKGYALYQINNYKESLVALQKVAKKDDTIGQIAHYYIGKIEAAMQQPSLALTAFKKAKEMVFCKNIKELATLQHAKLTYEQGDFQVVIQDLVPFIKTHSVSHYLPLASTLLSEAYCALQDYDSVIAHVENGINIPPDTCKVYQRATACKGNICFNQGAYKQAARLFKKSLQYPYDLHWVRESKFWIAESLSAMKQYDKAIPIYEGCIDLIDKKNPYYGNMMYGLAYAYFNTKHYLAALGYFERSIAEAHYKDTIWYDDAVVRLADCCYVTKDYQRALQLYDRILPAYPAHVHYQKALIYNLLGNMRVAQQNLQVLIHAYAHTPYCEKALYEMGAITFTQGNYELAIQQFTTFIERMPHSILIADARLKRGLAYENIKNNEAACIDYEMILQHDINHINAKNALLALTRLATGKGIADKLIQYRRAYQQAHIEDVAIDDLSIVAARALFYKEAYKDVILQLKDFVPYKKNNKVTTEAYYLIAESFYRLGDFGAAIAYYKQVLQYPKTVNYHKVLLRMATLLYNTKRFKSALFYYQKLQKSTSNKKEGHYALAGIMRASYFLKDYQLTSKMALLIVKNNIATETTHEALRYLGNTALQRKAYKSANSYFIRLVKVAKDHNGAEGQYGLALIQHRMKNYKKSLELLFELKQRFGEYPVWVDESFFLMAENYIALNNLMQAKATLRSVINKATDKVVIARAKKRLGALTVSVQNSSKIGMQEGQKRGNTVLKK